MRNLLVALSLTVLGCSSAAQSHAKNVTDTASYSLELEKCYNAAIEAYEGGASLTDVNASYEDCARRADAKYGRK